MGASQHKDAVIGKLGLFVSSTLKTGCTGVYSPFADVFCENTSFEGALFGGPRHSMAICLVAVVLLCVNWAKPCDSWRCLPNCAPSRMCFQRGIFAVVLAMNYAEICLKQNSKLPSMTFLCRRALTMTSHSSSPNEYKGRWLI